MRRGFPGVAKCFVPSSEHLQFLQLAPLPTRRRGGGMNVRQIGSCVDPWAENITVPEKYNDRLYVT